MARLPQRILMRAAIALSTVVGTPAPLPAQIAEEDAKLPLCSKDVISYARGDILVSPEPGQERTVEAGNAVVSLQKVVIREASLTLNQTITLTGTHDDPFTVTIPAETLEGTDLLSFRYGIEVSSYKVPNANLQLPDSHGRSSKAALWISVARDHTTLHGDLRLGSSIFKLDMPNAPVTRHFCRDAEPDVWGAAIIYSGVVKGVITLDYREHAHAIAHPAADQTGIFDLSNGSEIAFKGVHIKVLSATNLGLKYVILN